MQPAFYYTPNPKSATYIPVHKEHHSTGNFYQNFTPVSPKNSFESHKIDERLSAYNANANNVKHVSPIAINEQRHYKQ